MTIALSCGYFPRTCHSGFIPYKKVQDKPKRSVLHLILSEVRPFAPGILIQNWFTQLAMSSSGTSQPAINTRKLVTVSEANAAMDVR